MLFCRKKIDKQRRLEEFFTQQDQESRIVSPFFYDIDLMSNYDGLTFLIKLLLPRVQESLAAKLECLKMHGENMCFPGNVFDRQHAQRDPDESCFKDSENRRN